jgi:hypothetical protein
MITGLLVLAAHALTAAGQGQAKGEQPKVSVRLSFSVDEYDPNMPKGTIKCVVRNDMQETVEVPVGYDGRVVTVTGSGVTLYPRLQLVKKGVKYVQVEPGKEWVVFELPLADILKGERKSNSPWHWSWPRRSMPPLTPIHKQRGPGYVDRATFLATVAVRGHTLKSSAAVLMVKTGE